MEAKHIAITISRLKYLQYISRSLSYDMIHFKKSFFILIDDSVTDTFQYEKIFMTFRDS